MKNYRKWLIAVTVIFLVSVISHLSALRNVYVLDDFKLIMVNPFITRWENASILIDPQYLFKPYPLTCGARPLTVFSLMLDYRFWKLNPFGYHLTNILLHAANGIVLFFTAFLIFRSLGVPNGSGPRGETRGAPATATDGPIPRLKNYLLRAAGVLRKALKAGSPSGNTALSFAFLAALVFTLHPVQAEVVNIPSFRADLLATLFSLLALLLFAAALDVSRWRAAALYAGAGGSLLLALMGKEITIIVPFIFLLYRLLRPGPGISRRNLGIIIGFSAIAALFMTVFWSARYDYNGPSMIFINIQNNVSPFSSVAAYCNTLLHSLLHYARTLLVPFGLSVDYQLSALPGVLNGGNVLALIVLAACAALLAFSRDRWLRFGLGFAFLAYLPVSNIIPLLNTVNDRYMYLPMAGFSLFVAAAIRYLPGRGPGRRVSPRLAVGCALLCLYGTLTFQRNLVFRDIYTLNRDAMRVAPENIRVRYNYGIALMLKDRFADAITQFEAVERLNPVYQQGNICYLKGECYANTGDIAAASDYFYRSFIMQPASDTLLRYATLFVEEGDLAHATWILESGSMLFPGAIGYYDRTQPRFVDRDFPRLFASIRKVLSLKPDYENIWANVFLVQDRQGTASSPRSFSWYGRRAEEKDVFTPAP